MKGMWLGGDFLLIKDLVWCLHAKLRYIKPTTIKISYCQHSNVENDARPCACTHVTVVIVLSYFDCSSDSVIQAFPTAYSFISMESL